MRLDSGGRRYFLPLGRVGFVAPASRMEGAILVMPRGRLPVIDLSGRAGVAADSPARRVVAVRGRSGYIGLAADRVEFAQSGDGLELLDLSSLLSAEEELVLLAAAGQSVGAAR